ncbi:MAG: glycosyltransferase family 4 protein [Candidatus Rokubacteria bacterium]|nr:glycosyltransferase family 4 protein [Candidatus Rokubacteria bacterium]
MRVGLFTNNYLPVRGGVPTSVETLRAGLHALGHRAWVFAPRFPGSAPDPPGVVRFPSLPALTYPEFSLAIPWSRRVAQMIEGLALDIFHAQHPFLLGGTARRLARRQGQPLVFTYHTHYEKYAHYVPFRRGLVERLAVSWSTRFANGSDLVIAPSEAVRSVLRTRGVTTPIEVVPTGVPLDRFTPGDRARARCALGLPPDEPILLYVGRLDREKSVERLLDAFRLVVEALPRARLVVVGQGTQAVRLRARARGTSAGERVSFVGVQPREGLPDYYRAVDLFCFASQTETQGLVLAEAHASGLPCVAVAGPGVDEVVADGETGLLVKPDPRALAEAAIELLLDPVRRGAMGGRAREIACQHFGAERQSARVAALYGRLLNGGAAR